MTQSQVSTPRRSSSRSRIISTSTTAMMESSSPSTSPIAACQQQCECTTTTTTTKSSRCATPTMSTSAPAPASASAPASSPARSNISPNNRRVPTLEQANFYAQKLNNSAVLCIEIGEYDRAIVSLGRALKLSELCSSRTLKDSCLCHNCTLDGCITYSERIAEAIALEQKQQQQQQCAKRQRSSSNSTSGSSPSKKQRLSTLPSIATSPPCSERKKHEEAHEQERTHSGSNNACFYSNTNSTSTSGSIYRRPIRITPRTIQEGHNMGSTLFLISTFNLALAHHLSSLSLSSTTPDTDQVQLMKQQRLAKNASKLYELARSWAQRHSRELTKRWDQGYYEDDDEEEEEGEQQEQAQAQAQAHTVPSSPTTSQHQQESESESESCQLHPDCIRFYMIVCNNLCQLYRSADVHEPTKHKKRLSELLSSVMLLVDRKKLADEQQLQMQQQHRVHNNNNEASNATTMAPLLDLLHRDYCDDDEDASPWTSSNQNESIGRRYHLEEYLQNTTEMVLQGICADAA